MSEELIPVTWIKQYHFCPRIIYFLGVLGATERTTESMFEGKTKHLREEKLEKRRKTLGGDKRTKVKRKWTKLYVASERLGIVGVIDEVVEINGELAIVEVKHSKPTRKPPKHHLYQAVAYAMLAEEALRKPIRHIILRYMSTGETHNIE
ncbi:MAG: CRISPR-associated protein Cas4, partial [Thermoproteota archaeon]